jgi:hypothetical protein
MVSVFGLVSTRIRILQFIFTQIPFFRFLRESSAVLRIRDIILERIRIRRSVPLTNGSGSGSCYFRLCPYDANTKLYIFSHISQNSRDPSFSYYFCLVIKGSGSGPVPLTNRSGRPKNIRIPRLWIQIHTNDTK